MLFNIGEKVSMSYLKNRLAAMPLVFLLAFSLFAGCSPPPQIMGIDNPALSAASVPDVTRQRIFIATTRRPSEEPGVLYGPDRSLALLLASVDVTIPPNHVEGQLERPQQLPPDPRKDFTVTNPVTYATDADVIAEIRRELAKRAREDRKLLLFVHGFNNTYSDATLRLAQFVEDTGFEGVPILFTWASAATASRYVYDLNSTLVAREKIKEIADIMVRSKPESADVFAHSMGTFLTMEGLLDLQQAGTLGKRGEIGHIMLAAPDIDLDVFRTQLRQLSPTIRKKMYVLVSKDDKALRLSSRIAGGVPRVGVADTDELEALGVTVIDLSEIEDSASGSHSKFAGSPEVVRLIGVGLNSGHNFGQDNTPAIQKILSTSPIQIFGNGVNLLN